MATISIADNDARVQYTQAVTADTTQLTIDFPFFSLDDINVIVTSAAGVDTTLTRGTGTGTFAAVGTSVDDGFSGGYVTLGDTYSNAATKYTIFRDIDIERTTDFPTSGPFNISSLNTELDKIFAIEQELETKIGRTMKLADSDTAATLSLPNLDTRKGTVLAFNTTTGLPEAGPKIGDVSTIAAITTDIGTLADIEDGTDATDAIQTVAGISSNVTTVSGISSNVSTVAGISANVTAVAGDATDIGAVAAKATEIGRLGTVDAVSDLNTLGTADVVSDMNTLGTAANVTNMDTLAGISANITTVAGISSDVTSVAGDATDIGAVAAKATEIGRLGTADAVADLALLGTADAVSDMNTLGTASNVTNMDTLAGISGNITTVAGISSNITTVAGDATDIAAVAAKATEIGRLGTAAAVADMAILGTADVVADLNTLATSAIVTDMDALANLTTELDALADITSNITTVAGISSNVTTVAGISSDVTAAVGNSANITTVAGVSTNVTTVAGSISNVNTVATNLSSINDFADKYRIGSTDPTTNNDEGDLFYNTASNTLKVYTGSAFEAGVTAGSGFAALAGATFTGDVGFGDSVVAKFGASDDLTIQHNGTHSIIRDQGTGDLRLRANNLVAQNSAGTATYADFNNGGSVDLYHNNVQKFQTTSAGIDVIGTAQADSFTLDNGSNDWTFTVSSNNLIFSYAGTAKMKLDSSGNLTVTGDLISEGTI